MANKGLIQFVKNNPVVYKTYSVAGRVLTGALSLFVKPDDHLILFNSYGGKKFDDSPKAIYEYMKNDERFKDYRLVWAFNDPARYPEADSVKSDGLSYLITALKARCWVSNSSIQRGIDFKGKKTFSFNTWHGTPLKKMGADSRPDFDNTIISNCDVILTQSRYESDIFTRAWQLPEDRFRIFGLPRNDVLAKAGEEKKKELKEKLGLPADKKVILYAPTFRDYQTDSMGKVGMELPLDYDYWEEKLGDEWVFLLRVHYEVIKYSKIPETGMWYDFSAYDDLNELMMASDILISDYSSVLFDYAILERPMFGYIYDYDEYNEKRGMYFDIRKEISCFEDDRALADHIASMDADSEKKKCVEFRSRYVEEYGNAAKRSADLIYSELEEKNG